MNLAGGQQFVGGFQLSGKETVFARALDLGAQQLQNIRGCRAWLQWLAQVQSAAGDQHFNGQDAAQVGNRGAQLACCMPA